MNYQHIGTIGESQNPNENLFHPRGIAIDPENGNIIVADTSQDRIQIYDINGVYLRTINSFNGLQISNPKSLAIASNGNIIVSDHSNNRVCYYSRNGDELGFVNQYHVGPDTVYFSHPYAVGVGIINGVERILVGDSHNSNIVIFEMGGQLYNSFSTENEIGTMVSLDIDNNGNIHCVQAESIERVVIYNSAGVLQRIQSMNTPFSFIPKVIHIDRNSNNIYLTDQRNNCIAIFDSNYVLLRIIPEIDIGFKLILKQADLPDNLEEDVNCAICQSLILERGTEQNNILDNIGGSIVQLHPNHNPLIPHLFHNKCIKTWFLSQQIQQKTCPSCRRPINFFQNLLNINIPENSDGVNFFERLPILQNLNPEVLDIVLDESQLECSHYNGNQIECITHKPKCLWKFKNKQCINNPKHIGGNVKFISKKNKNRKFCKKTLKNNINLLK